MTESDPTFLPTLHALADAAGIERAYHDIYGTRHEADPDALVALLASLGHAAATTEEAARSLEQITAERWGRMVPPVTVLRRGRPFVAHVIVAEGTQGGPLPWRIELEDGSVRSGDAAGLAAEESHTTRVRVVLPLPDDLPDGYHTLQVGEDGRGSLIVTPGACWLPGALAGDGRAWGIGAQVYALRSDSDWGMGDFSDLATLSAAAGQLGADLVGINPLHALFLTKPEDASPYSPCSRLFLNPLYIAVEEVAEFATCTDAQERVRAPAFRQRLAAARAATHVDYGAVLALKRPVLETLFAAFEHGATPDRRAAFDAFCAEQGERLHQFAVFQALQDHYGTTPWPQWAEDHRAPDTPAVARFAEDNAAAVRFHLWLQFEADLQLASAARTLADNGGRIGLYRDLAVGANPDSADTWIDPDAYATRARCGAPPDDLGPLGQDWGLPPFNPEALKRLAYGPFIDMVRANMRHAGALRIDHAMAVQHLFWVPPGKTAVDGIYVSYPMEDLLGILALESHRARCLVIGEDLGTVPEGFRDRMAQENILSYRVFYFERYESGLFKRPDTYPRLALACATSHDMATIPGHWRAWDVNLRHDLHLARADLTRDDDLAARAEERRLLVAALQDQGLLPADFPTAPELRPGDQERLIAAVHCFLARTPSALMMVNIDDLAEEITQVNVPGTVSEYPNWRRRLALDTAAILATPPVEAAAAEITRLRGPGGQ